jgi:hypothetical protein
MDHYKDPQSTLTIALHGLANITDRFGGPLIPLTIALHRGLYLVIIKAVIEGPKLILL